MLASDVAESKLGFPYFDATRGARDVFAVESYIMGLRSNSRIYDVLIFMPAKKVIVRIEGEDGVPVPTDKTVGGSWHCVQSDL